MNCGKNLLADQSTTHRCKKPCIAMELGSYQKESSTTSCGTLPRSGHHLDAKGGELLAASLLGAIQKVTHPKTMKGRTGRQKSTGDERRVKLDLGSVLEKKAPRVRDPDFFRTFSYFQNPKTTSPWSDAQCDPHPSPSQDFAGKSYQMFKNVSPTDPCTVLDPKSVPNPNTL